jgi:hypothetical protein
MSEVPLCLKNITSESFHTDEIILFIKKKKKENETEISELTNIMAIVDTVSKFHLTAHQRFSGYNCQRF